MILPTTEASNDSPNSNFTTADLPGIETNISTSGRNSIINSVLLRIGLMLFGTILALVFLEAAFRLVAPHLMHSTSSDLPKEYYFPESKGMYRDFPYSTTKPPGTFRIIVVGDSFTYNGAMQVYDTFPKRLERFLNLNNKQRRVEVINYSLSGTATAHQVRMVRHAVKHYSPDLVILQITLNDVEPRPYQVTHSYQDSKGRIVLRSPIFHYWKSLDFVVKRIYNTVNNAEYKRYYIDSFNNAGNWQLFTDSLASMKAVTQNNHVRFAAMVFPLFSFPIDEKYPFSILHQHIGNALQELSVPYLDLQAAYSNIAPDRLQLIPDENPHPSELANRIAADFLYRFLRDQELIPEDTVVKRTRRRRAREKTPVVLGPDDSSWE